VSEFTPDTSQWASAHTYLRISRHGMHVTRRSVSPHDRMMYPTVDSFSDELQQITNYDKGAGGVGWGVIGWGW